MRYLKPSSSNTRGSGVYLGGGGGGGGTVVAGPPVWDAATAYTVGTDVTDGGKVWRALTANTGSRPSPTNTNWQLMTPPPQTIGFAAVDSDRPAAPSDGEMVFNESRQALDRWNQAKGRWESIGDIGVYPTVADLPSWMHKGDVAYVDADDALYILADDPASHGNLKWKAVGAGDPVVPKAQLQSLVAASADWAAFQAAVSKL